MHFDDEKWDSQPCSGEIASLLPGRCKGDCNLELRDCRAELCAPSSSPGPQTPNLIPSTQGPMECACFSHRWLATTTNESGIGADSVGCLLRETASLCLGERNMPL